MPCQTIIKQFTSLLMVTYKFFRRIFGMEPIFIFKPLEENHLDILCDWFNKTHVKEWWDDHLTNEKIKEKYRQRIGDTIVFPFIAYLDERPIGFIQYYHTDKISNNWWPDEMDSTVGIDQFIGEENHINRGYGTQMIGQFMVKLFSEVNIKKIITDVDEKNHRAIRCYEKLGFYLSNKVTTPDGTVNLMTKYQNISIEPHAPLLKKPNEGALLYKVISSKNFIHMVENDYLYFRRVDSYSDDKRDSDQPDKDKESSKKSKFENAIDYTAKNYYDSCRSKTYACCFSTEATSHIWRNYGEGDPNAICLVFDCHKLINFLNITFDETRIIYRGQRLINFFYINHSLVTYGNFDNAFLKQHLPNPIEYVYFKNAEKYMEEKEFRISLSCLGSCKHTLPNGTEFLFPDSLMFAFDFAEAIRRKVLKQIIIHNKSKDTEKIKKALKDIFDKKKVTLSFTVNNPD